MRASVTHPSPPVLDVRHTLSCTILCNRIRIDARWEKSPARVHRASASPPSSSRSKSGSHTRDAKQIQPHLGDVTPKPTKSSKRRRIGVRSHQGLPVVVVGVFVAVAGRIFELVVQSRRASSCVTDKRCVRWRLLMGSTGSARGGNDCRRQRCQGLGWSVVEDGRMGVSFAVTVGARWNEDTRLESSPFLAKGHERGLGLGWACLPGRQQLIPVSRRGPAASGEMGPIAIGQFPSASGASPTFSRS